MSQRIKSLRGLYLIALCLIGPGAWAGLNPVGVLPVLLSQAAVALDLEGCESQCADEGGDMDGDGISGCVESCLGTDDALVDTDDDGMPDGFEIRNGLDPLTDDSGGDLDADEMTNLDEFLEDSDPADPFSPYDVHVVSPDGDNENGDGSQAAPWRTVGFAINNMVPVPERMPRLVLKAGIYPESVVMTPGLILSAALGADVTIIGQLVGASGATLERVTLVPAAESAYIVDMNDVAMTLEGVVFQGTPERDRTGVLIDGVAPATSVFDQCTFTSLGVGLDVGDAVPTVRRCVFGDFPVSFGPSDATGAAIYIRENGKTEAGWRSIGDEADPANGWNDFLPTIEGFAVVNERDEVVTMQNNYWGVTDPALFPTRVNGAAVVEPILASSSAVLASTLICTVWNDADQKRIENASVFLQISAFDGVQHNTEGVYAFPAIQGGDYRVVVQAVGYQDIEALVTVGDGDLKSLAIPMRASLTQREENASRSQDGALASCFGTKSTVLAGAKRNRGDLFLLALSVGSLLVWGRFSTLR